VFAWYLPRTRTATRIITGKILIVIGFLLPIGAAIGFFVDSSTNPFISLGVLIKTLVGAAIALPWGTKLVQQAKKEETASQLHSLLSISCPDCKFFDKSAVQRGEPWCTRPIAPIIKSGRCLSIEIQS